MDRTRAFTLPELCACVCVLATLLAAGVPAMIGMREAAATNAALHTLTASIASARIAAIGRGHPVSVCPSADGRHCRFDLRWDEGWIVYLDRNRRTDPESASDVLRHERPSPGLSIRSTGARHRLRFQPSGLAGGSNLTLRLCRPRGPEAVADLIVNIAGRTRVARAAEGAACAYTP